MEDLSWICNELGFDVGNDYGKYFELGYSQLIEILIEKFCETGVLTLIDDC